MLESQRMCNLAAVGRYYVVALNAARCYVAHRQRNEIFQCQMVMMLVSAKRMKTRMLLLTMIMHPSPLTVIHITQNVHNF